MWHLINVSNNLHMIGVKFTGLYLTGLFLDPFLNNGVMFACFHSEGTIPFPCDKLNTWCINVILYRLL